MTNLAIDLIEPFLRDLGQRLIATEVTGVREKGPMDVVSELDLTAEREITQFLSTHFPGDSLLSEESANTVNYADRIWVLDPLDGTVNLTSGIPFVAISLALLEQGTPTLGFVYDLIHQEMFSARVGEGAKLNGQTIKMSSSCVRTIALTTGVVRKLALESPHDLVALLQNHGKLRGLGAQTLQLAYVAAGRIGAAIGLETRLWDNAAGALLVKEAGGSYCDLNRRNPFPIEPGDSCLRGAANPCIAAAPGLLDEIYPTLVGLTA